MAPIGLFYGSTGGSTHRVARLVKDAFGDEEVRLHSVETADPEDLDQYDRLIFGVSTYGRGSLQEFWADFIWELDDVDLSGKKVALFGLGDQVEYPGSFLNAMGTLYEKARELGAEVVGYWPTEGYTFTGSNAIAEGAFVGLAIDEDRQRSLTEERVKQWVAQLLQEFA
jgi:flavodoxin I